METEWSGCGRGRACQCAFAQRGLPWFWSPSERQSCVLIVSKVSQSGLSGRDSQMLFSRRQNGVCSLSLIPIQKRGKDDLMYLHKDYEIYEEI